MNSRSTSLNNDGIIAIFKESWPPLFCGKELDKLTGKILQWRTIQNRRSRGEIPEDCFVKVSTRKVAIIRDNFLSWLNTDIVRHNPISNNKGKTL